MLNLIKTFDWGVNILLEKAIYFKKKVYIIKNYGGEEWQRNFLALV